MPSAVRCPSCGHALFVVDGPPISVSVPTPAPAAASPPPGAARGEVPVVRIGKSVRVSRRELERMASI